MNGSDSLRSESLIRKELYGLQFDVEMVCPKQKIIPVVLSREPDPLKGSSRDGGFLSVEAVLRDTKDQRALQPAAEHRVRLAKIPAWIFNAIRRLETVSPRWLHRSPPRELGCMNNVTTLRDCQWGRPMLDVSGDDCRICGTDLEPRTALYSEFSETPSSETAS